MDPLAIVLTTVAAILSVVLLVVGVQAILVLQEVRRSLRNFNRMTEVIEESVTRTLAPFQQLGGMGSGLRTGLKLLDTFTTFIHSKQHDSQTDKDSK